MIQARRVLAISPHLDDAALSAGALLAGLADRGSEVHVATLFAGPPREDLSPVARVFHGNCGLPPDATAMALRRREDAAAMKVLGAKALYAELPDAVYRRRRDGGWVCGHDRAMFSGPSPEDDIMAGVRASVGRFMELVAPDLVITCAAMGGHTDHLLTSTAVIAVVAPAEARVLLWEDLPYAISIGLPANRCPPLLIPVSPAEWARKLEAAARYASQTRMLWPDQADWAQALADHAMSRGDGQLAEMLWDARAAADAQDPAMAGASPLSPARPSGGRR